MATVKHLTTTFQPRPDHNLPKNLQPNETQCLIDILGQDRLAITAAAVQILFGLNGRWEKQVCGLLCFVKDCEHRAYLFQVFDLSRRVIIYEYSVPGTTRLDKCTDLFYTFDGATCRVGINFADRDEAQAFFHHFQRKQEDRRARREQRAQIIHTPEKNGSMTPGEPKSPKLSHDDKSKSGALMKFLTIKQKPKTRISAPIKGTFDHRNAIKIDGCFFKDDECRKLFDTVVSEMNISPEEAEYVRGAIANVTDGFANFVKRKQRRAGAHHSTNENNDSSSKTSTPPATRKNPNTRRPFQDIAVPAFTHFQTTNGHHGTTTTTSMAPPIPERTRQHPAAPPVAPPLPPPGPIPIAPPLPPPGPIPVAPPLPPPGPIPVVPPLPPPGPIRNDSSHSEVAVEKATGSSGGKAAWLVDIESSKINLKKTPEKPHTPPPPVENSKQTMEEYIRELIKIRRAALMGKKHSDDEEVEESDGFDEDFD